MMGLMCARTLRARGQRVCVVEAETCGAGASGRSSGLITPDSELELRDLVQQFGPDAARKLWEFALGGVNALRQAILEDRIDCDMQAHDALFVAATSQRSRSDLWPSTLRDRSLGYSSTFYSRENLPAILASTAYFGALRFGGRPVSGTLIVAASGCAKDCSKEERESSSAVRSRGSWRMSDTPAGSVRAPAVIICADRFLPALGLARREVYHVQTFLAISECLGSADIERIFPLGSASGLGH